MANAHIPKYGGWVSDGNIPCTNIHKSISEGKSVNPNVPQENPDAFSKDNSQVHAPTHRAGSKDEKQSSIENGGPSSDYPIHRDPMDPKPASDSPRYLHGERTSSGDPQRKASRTSGGFDRSIEHSPLHPHYQVKSAGKGEVSSPTWERRISSEGSHVLAPNTPGRSRLKNGGRGNDTPERSSAVPKFGEWDESKPSSADDYSHIFNKVKEERQGGSAKVPIVSNDSIYVNDYQQDNSSPSTSCWCFSWSKK